MHRIFKNIAVLLTAGLALAVLSAPGYAVHEGLPTPNEIKTTPDGVKYLAHLELDKLSVCSTCPYGVNHTPEFASASNAGKQLSDDDLVIGVNLGGTVKAYPARLLEHPSSHIINDMFEGLPVIVTWCPLCHSAVVFARPHVGGRILEFGTAGAYQRDLVMYDAQTHSLWQQITGEPIAGPLLGAVGHLHPHPADLVPWAGWKQAHSDTEVLIGWKRSGNASALSIYHEIAHGRARSEVSLRDVRLPADAIVIGVVAGNVPKAYLRETLDRVHLVNDVVGGVEILVLRHPTAGEVKVFRRHVVGEEGLVFELRSGLLVDKETATVWSFDGVAELGRLKGTRLEKIPAVPAFWFAWAQFFPNTELLR